MGTATARGIGRMNCLARLPDKNDNVRLTQDKADFRVSVRGASW
jgi:hypothetical protein